jgi:serine protease inhibitor
MYFVPAPTGTGRTGTLVGHRTSARLLLSLLLICAASSAQTPRYTPSFHKFVEGNNRFAFRYVQLRQQRDTNENVLIAPASLSVAFGLLQNGADTATNEEIGKVFGRESLPVSEVNSASWQLLRRVSESRSGERNFATNIAMSNSLWIGSSESFKPEIVQTADYLYGATANSLPGDRIQARQMVSTVLRKSLGRTITPPDIHLKPNEFCVLAVSVFDGKWAPEFDEARTAPNEFRLRDHSKLTVNMMWQKREKYEYLKHEKFQAVQLPYTDGYAMYVFLPQEDDGIDGLVKTLTPENWKQWKESFRENPGTVEMPKFHLELKGDITDDLRQFGISKAFSSLSSLRELVANPLGAQLTHVSADALIDVTEKRTYIEFKGQMAGVIGGIVAGAPPPPKPFHMIIDHPFLFVIIDGNTDTIHYIGVVTRPTEVKAVTKTQ